MPTKLTITTVKPAGTLWFKETETAKADQIRAWTRNFPGYVSGEGKKLNSTTWQNVIIFQNRERCNAFLAERESYGPHVSRTAFQRDNNQVSTTEITEI